MNAGARLAGAFLTAHPVEAAPLLERAAAEAGAEVLGKAPPAAIAAALQRMAPPQAAALLARLPDECRQETLTVLSLGAATALLGTLESGERERVLATLPAPTARALAAALSHPAGSAGAMMDAAPLVFPAEISVGDARRRARRREPRSGNYLYVVDADRRLVGVVSLRELMFASPRATLASIMRASTHALGSRADASAILAHPGWRELHAIPVVDAHSVLLGVLRRECYERLRDERHGPARDASGEMGIALAELAWTAMLSTIDAVAGGAPDEE